MRELSWRDFSLVALTFTVILFGIFRVTFLLYMGLIYALTLYASREHISPKKPRLDGQSVVGAFLISVSPIFLHVQLGGYPSPSTFHALFLLGLQLMLFQLKGLEVPTLILVGEVGIALSARLNLVESLINRTSSVFVDITSVLVKALVVLSGIPIEINKNVAVVRKSIVVIGSGCSGLDAFVIYILATLLLIYLRKSDGKEATLLLAGALGIIPLNAIRIFTLLVIGYHSGISFLELFHSHLGDLMFLLYVYAYWWLVLKGRKKEKGSEIGSGNLEAGW